MAEPPLTENYHKETATRRHIPAHITFWDETLRDGEQMPGVHFSAEEKLAIAEKLAEVGVEVINAGIPVVSKDEEAMVHRIAHAGIKAHILAAGRTVPGDVEAIIRTGATHAAIFVAASEVHLRYKLRMSQDEVVKATVDSVRRAHEAGLHVAFVTEDTTRAPMDFVEKLYLAALDAGADRLVVSDTVGVMSPITFRWFLREFSARVHPKDWSVHCHNDFGMATANTIAAMEEGVNAPHVCVNGLGERAGNTSFEEVVMSLEILYGIKTGIKTEKLYELSRLVERLSGVPLPPNKALVGYNAFSHEAGIHTHGVLRNSLTYEPLQPEVLGRKRRFILGKHTGRAAIQEKLKESGISPTDDQVARLTELVKTTEEHKGKELRNRMVADYQNEFEQPGLKESEFWTLAGQVGIERPKSP